MNLIKQFLIFFVCFLIGLQSFSDPLYENEFIMILWEPYFSTHTNERQNVLLDLWQLPDTPTNRLNIDYWYEYIVITNPAQTCYVYDITIAQTQIINDQKISLYTNMLGSTEQNLFVTNYPPSAYIKLGIYQSGSTNELP